jgi:hypothetical protein
MGEFECSFRANLCSELDLCIECDQVWTKSAFVSEKIQSIFIKHEGHKVPWTSATLECFAESVYERGQVNTIDTVVRRMQCSKVSEGSHIS